jgi:hypothetical protein
MRQYDVPKEIIVDIFAETGCFESRFPLVSVELVGVSLLRRPTARVNLLNSATVHSQILMFDSMLKVSR